MVDQSATIQRRSNGESAAHIYALPCAAHRTDGEPCKAYAMAGSTVCYHHGGAGNKSKAFTALVKQSEQAAAIVYGAPVDTTPEEVLGDELARTAGHVAWLQDQLIRGDPTQFAKSLWLRARQSGYIKPEELQDFAWEASQAIWVDLYQKERTHLVKVAATAIGAGLEERKVRVAEQMVEQIGLAVTEMLEALGHDPADPEVRSIAYTAISKAAGKEAA